MPIYAYRCAECGQAKDVLQKLSDPVLSVCPFCGAEAFSKQLTAAGFHLKGSGWYATDFKGGGGGAAKPADDKESSAPAAAKGDKVEKGDAGGKTSTPPAASAGGGAPAGACGGSCACH